VERPVKTILLTGGSGFIGRNILESRLASRFLVLAPRHSELDFMDEDRVREFLRTHLVDVVIHAAAKPSHRNVLCPMNTLQPNLRMFFNLVQNAAHYSRLIVIGSGAVYDKRHYRPLMAEEYANEHVPIDDLGLCRHVIYRHIEATRQDAYELRLFGIFGKYEDYAIRFISNAICKTVFDLPITLRQNRVFSYLSIEDFLRILEFFIEEDPPERIWNIVPDERVELLHLAESVRELSGSRHPVVVGAHGMGSEYSGDNRRFRTWKPNFQFTPISVTIRGLYSWYVMQRASIRRELLLADPQEPRPRREGI
jgi:UDP-glucose 4-epimerase